MVKGSRCESGADPPLSPGDATRERATRSSHWIADGDPGRRGAEGPGARRPASDRTARYALVERGGLHAPSSRRPRARGPRAARAGIRRGRRAGHRQPSDRGRDEHAVRGARHDRRRGRSSSPAAPAPSRTSATGPRPTSDRARRRCRPAAPRVTAASLETPLLHLRHVLGRARQPVVRPGHGASRRRSIRRRASSSPSTTNGAVRRVRRLRRPDRAPATTSCSPTTPAPSSCFGSAARRPRSPARRSRVQRGRPAERRARRRRERRRRHDRRRRHARSSALATAGDPAAQGDEGRRRSARTRSSCAVGGAAAPGRGRRRPRRSVDRDRPPRAACSRRRSGHVYRFARFSPRLIHVAVAESGSGLRTVKLRLTRRVGDRCFSYSGKRERFIGAKCGHRVLLHGQRPRRLHLPAPGAAAAGPLRPRRRRRSTSRSTATAWQIGAATAVSSTFARRAAAGGAARAPRSARGAAGRLRRRARATRPTARALTVTQDFGVARSRRVRGAEGRRAPTP